MKSFLFAAVCREKGKREIDKGRKRDQSERGSFLPDSVIAKP